MRRQVEWAREETTQRYRVQGAGVRSVGGLGSEFFRLEIVETEAGTVRLIYWLYQAGGPDTVGIQKELMRLGVATRSGSTFWSLSAIQRNLKDPVYRGTRRSGVAAPEIVDLYYRRANEPDVEGGSSYRLE